MDMDMDDNETIHIQELLPENRCSVCNRIMPTKREVHSRDYEGLMEVQVKTSHSRCNKLLDRRRRLTEQLLDLEYIFFVMRGGVGAG